MSETKIPLARGEIIAVALLIIGIVSFFLILKNDLSSIKEDVKEIHTYIFINGVVERVKSGTVEKDSYEELKKEIEKIQFENKDFLKKHPIENDRLIAAEEFIKAEVLGLRQHEERG